MCGSAARHAQKIALRLVAIVVSPTITLIAAASGTTFTTRMFVPPLLPPLLLQPARVNMSRHERKATASREVIDVSSGGVREQESAHAEYRASGGL
jgi:hypothetical protein